jgi:tape measure domain-containing protein
MADIAQLGIEIDTRKLKSGEKDLASFASTADKTSSVVATATKAIATMAAAFATSQIIKAADAYSMMNARVSRFTDSAESATAVMRSLTNYANAAGAEVGSAVAVFTSLSGALQDVGTSQSDILRLTETLNKLGVIGGSSADEVSNALRQFAQSMAGGVVRAEEFNSIIENTPEIARAIGAGMNLSMGQLRAAMLNGQLTSEAVLNSLMSQTETVDAQFAKMPRTVSAAMQTMENEFGGLVGVLNNSTGATSTLAGGIDALSGALVTAKDHTSEIITVAEALAAVYASRLVGSMVASKAAMTAFTAAMTLFNGASAVATVRTDSLGMSYTTMATRATVGATTIRGLNGAMAMLGGPAGVVMLAVSAIYLWISATDEARQKAIDYADGVDTATASLRNMTSAQLAASQVKLGQSIDGQAVAVSDLRSEVDDLQSTVNEQIAVSKMLGNATAANTYEMDQLKLKSAELESAESKLSQMRSKSYAITQALNGNLKDNYVAMQNSNSVTGIANGIQSVFNGVLNTGNKLLQQRNNYVLLGNGAKSNLTATDQKYLTQLENEIALEKELDPIKRARIKAEQEAAAQGLSASGTTQYINQSVKLAEIQAKNDAASKSLTAAHKSEASAIKEAAKSAEEYAQFQTELTRMGATEAQQIKNWQDDKLADLDLYHAQGLVKASEYEFGKQAIMAEANRRTKKLNDDQWSEYLNGSSAALLKLKQQAQTQLTGPKQQIVVSGIDKKLKEQTFSDLPTIDGGAQSNEQNQIAQLQTQTQAMNDAYNQRIEQYKLYRASEVENAAYYDSQIAALEKKKEENNKNAQAAMLNLQLSAGEAMAASAADSFKSILGEQSGAYRAMFAVQKAFSIAQSMIAIQTGIAMAAANPWPLNIGAMATVAAATANIVSSIMSIASPSFDGGGYTGNGSRSGGLDGKGGFWAMMHPQETVIDHTKSSGPLSSVSSSGGNVTVNVSLQETSDTRQQGTTQQTTGDDGSVQINVFVADIRSEGSMAQVLERTYGLTRMGA